ncbi:MAG: phosphotransferase [Planctomycetota bacterium]
MTNPLPPSNEPVAQRRPWDPEVELPRDLVARLIGRHMPRLAPLNQLELLGQGWDNAAWLVNGTHVVRFVRRELGVALLRAECEFLPWLAPQLPVAVPVPDVFVERDPEYVFPFASYEMLPGRTGCRVPLDDAARAALALPLARFLGALHAVPRPTDRELPGDHLGRADRARRVERLCIKLDDMVNTSAIDAGIAAAVKATLRRTATSPAWPAEPVWCHGDFYARHILLDDHAQLCGVIDWGDVHIGDPAGDASIACSLLPPSSRDAFFAEWSRVSGLEEDAGLRDRAQFRALQYGVYLLDYGLSVDDAAMRDIARYALRAVDQ